MNSLLALVGSRPSPCREGNLTDSIIKELHQRGAALSLPAARLVEGASKLALRSGMAALHEVAAAAAALCVCVCVCECVCLYVCEGVGPEMQGICSATSRSGDYRGCPVSD